ncbi:TetR/AcrR family transcriptional regulator [Streptomyces uncialis]|uniref:TetR/AcrR family transcriptional regulator n=1 Tax=Streptomyces uncialis TaxID=1048205 RepID=UPI003863D47B
MVRPADRSRRPGRSSVWLADGSPRGASARRSAHPSGLDRDVIIRTTVELLDAEGLAKFSMRRLAAELNVTAMSVYWYVDTKDDLLELALDRAFGELRLPELSLPGGEARGRGPGSPLAGTFDAGTFDGAVGPVGAAAAPGEPGPGDEDGDGYGNEPWAGAGAGVGNRDGIGNDGTATQTDTDTDTGTGTQTATAPHTDADWRDMLRSLARELRNLLVRHPWISPLAGTFLNVGPHSLNFSRTAQRIIRRTGLAAHEQMGALSAVFQFVYGFGTIEGQFLQRCRAAGMSQDAYFQEAMSAVAMSPGVAETIGEATDLMAARGGDTVEEMREREYVFALELLIAGIETMVARGAEAGTSTTSGTGTSPSRPAG